MRKNSIESKQRTGQRWSSPCQQNQQTVNQFFRQRPQQRGTLRRCQSASSLVRRGNNDLPQLQHKYRLLEQEYRRTVQIFRGKTQIFQQQKKEIQRLNILAQRQEKQINRLQQMIRLTQKKDYGLQTEGQLQKSTWRKRIELSNGQSDLTAETRCQQTPVAMRRQSRSNPKKSLNHVSSSRVNLSKISKYNGNGSGKGNSGERVQKMQKGPLNKKYKFVPTLAFKHI